MTIHHRIQAFAQLGEFLSQFADTFTKKKNLTINSIHYNNFAQLIVDAPHSNAWFTTQFVQFAITSIAQMLNEENLYNWLNKYNLPIKNENPKTVGVVMAGNIPLVGFHDMLCVLITGNNLLCKLSSKDDKLLKAIAEVLKTIIPEFTYKIKFTDHILNNFEAIIATGSNNSSRYFEYYFKKYPHIIRRNRNAVAVLTGTETTHELELLGKDIFTYYGLGCRNVSKLYTPLNFNFEHFFEAIEPYNFVGDHFKYHNNYDYNKAIYLVNGTPHLDNNFLLLSQNNSLNSPIACLHYQNYTTIDTLTNELQLLTNELQCIVSQNGIIENSISFGTAQTPNIDEYADNIDTIKFLL